MWVWVCNRRVETGEMNMRAEKKDTDTYSSEGQKSKNVGEEKRVLHGLNAKHET